MLDPESGEVVEERFSADRESLARWADGCRGRVVAVAIEATTGWRPIPQLLDLFRRNPRLGHSRDRHLPRQRNAQRTQSVWRFVPGRKTDVADSAWICQLVEHGLVRANFVPPKPIRELRDLTRYRKAQIEERSREVQRLDKVLQDAGIKVSSVASETLGVSVRRMLDALVAGTHDPALLAELARGRLRRKLPALREALTGRFRTEHHGLLVSQILAHIEYLDETIAFLSAQIGCCAGLPAGRRASREQEHDRAAAGRIGRRRKTNLRRRTKALPALVAAAAAFSLVPAVSGCGHRSQLAVTIAGSVERVPDGTTLAEAALIFRLRPQAGNLLDVQGRVLRVGAFPGWLLLDGRRVSGATRLQSGDQVQPVQGRDRNEPLRRQLVPVPGGAPSDPQFVLARAPGLEVVVRGALSHALVSARFRPTRGQQAVERAVALTFDDGPSPNDTPRILAVLRRLHAHATFFLIGYLVERYPQVVARERQDGMAIGNHTYNHPEVPPFAQLPRRLLVDEIALGAQSLARLGIRPRLLRPPGGSVSRAVVQAAQALDERVVLWSVDPTDWRLGVTARQIARRVLSAVRPGSIVILHDGGGDRSATVAALPAIIKGIRRRGLRLVEIAAG